MEDKHNLLEWLLGQRVEKIVNYKNLENGQKQEAATNPMQKPETSAAWGQGGERQFAYEAKRVLRGQNGISKMKPWELTQVSSGGREKGYSVLYYNHTVTLSFSSGPKQCIILVSVNSSFLFF